MYFNKFLASIVLVICVLKLSQASFNKTPFSLEEAMTWLPKNYDSRLSWISDTEFFYYASDVIRLFNANKRSSSKLLTIPLMNALGYRDFESISISPDKSLVLVRYNVIASDRSSSKLARYDVVEFKIQDMLKVHKGERLQYCDFNPVDNRIAFVYENDVFIRYNNEKEIQITTSGKNGSIYNGVPDLVYGEEIFTTGSALWWSPDGNFLAIAVFDDTAVETVNHYVYDEGEDSEYLVNPEVINVKYPMAGRNNPKVFVKVFDLRSADNITFDILSAPECDSILKNVAWTPDNQLLIFWLNRRQNIANLQLCSVKGVCNQSKRFVEDSGWIEIGTPICLKNITNCIFPYWVDNSYKIWNLDFETGENLWENRSTFDVLKLYGYDEVRDIVYYRGILESDPSQFHVFANNDCLTCNLTDLEYQECFSGDASFSKDLSYYVAFCTGPTPPYAIVFKTSTSNALVLRLVTNEYFYDMRALHFWPEFETIEIPLPDGTMSMVRVVHPRLFSYEKKYPMIVHVHGGPNSVSVTNEFRLDFEAYMATNREVYYILIDVRGSGNKGKRSLFSVNNHLGEFEVEDIIFVTKFLQNNITSMDKDRCAIWGKGYGGYLTAFTLANDAGLFQCGISVAPITSWFQHNSIFSERYMGKPCENFFNYLNSTISQKVDNFRNHNFLLIHGSNDFTVRDQHSILLAKTLQKNNILFEQLIYPDENHKFEHFNLHLHHSMDSFFCDCFHLDVQEKYFEQVDDPEQNYQEEH